MRRHDEGEGGGVLCAGDRVRLAGLTGEIARNLNSREGYVVCITGEAPYQAQLPGNRYVVDVIMDHNVVERSMGGSVRGHPKYKRCILTRKFLEPITLGLSSYDQVDLGPEEEKKGFFSALEESDESTLRKLLNNLKAKGLKRPADEFLDWAGNTALYCAIEHGYADIVKMLIEYETNVNYPWGPKIPVMRDEDVLPLQLALVILSACTEKAFAEDKEDGNKLAQREEIVLSLIRAGADLSYMSDRKGTPLMLACSLPLYPQSRLKVSRLLLDYGADPNQMVATSCRFQTLPLLSAFGSSYFGGDDERLELFQMLLNAGADPGKLCRVGNEACNTLHLAAARRHQRLLKMLLESEKGRAAVDVRRRSTEPLNERGHNGDNESALLMVVSSQQIAENAACRKCAILLLKAGADPEAEDSHGMKPSMWLFAKVSKKHGELGELVRSARGKGVSFWDSRAVRSFVGGDDERGGAPSAWFGRTQ